MTWNEEADLTSGCCPTPTAASFWRTGVADPYGSPEKDRFAYRASTYYAFFGWG